MIPRIYSTEEAAFRRVDVLKRTGIWPGVRRRHDGKFQLTFDPGTDTEADQ